MPTNAVGIHIRQDARTLEHQSRCVTIAGRRHRAISALSQAPFWCLCCNRGGAEPRRRHVICSGVLAVAAVTAAGVSVPGPIGWLARRVPLRRPELAGQFPRRLVLPAADGSALKLGELAVPGDRRSLDHPGVTMGRALRPTGRRRGAGGLVLPRAGITACARSRFIGGQVPRRLQRAHHAG